jgi:hypothetical protein
MKSVKEMMEVIDDLDVSGIEDLTLSMTTEFSEALENSVKIKLKVSVFDSFKMEVR